MQVRPDTQQLGKELVWWEVVLHVAMPDGTTVERESMYLAVDEEGAYRRATMEAAGIGGTLNAYSLKQVKDPRPTRPPLALPAPAYSPPPHPKKEYKPKPNLYKVWKDLGGLVETAVARAVVLKLSPKEKEAEA